MPASTRSVCAHSGSQTSARSRFWRMTTSAVTSACGEKAVLGRRTAPTSSARSAILLRAAGFFLSSVP